MEKAFYDKLHQVEQLHWWYVARRSILDRLLTSVAPTLPSGILYDLGCGVGANLPVLQKHGPTIGIDSSPEALAYSRARGCGDIRLGDLDRLEGFPEKSASLVLLADVLEHLDQEDACLRAVHRLLKPGGVLIVTVPALMLLWGKTDQLAHHRRRYTKRSLRKLIESYLEVERMTYFNTVLFAPILAGRILQKVLRRDGYDEAKIPPSPINSMLTAIFAAESHLIGRIHLPIGISLLCVARLVELRREEMERRD